MDLTDQVYETDAEGWLAGCYADIKTTFRAPIVNWIFRTLAANHPAFLRYTWSQVKPIFQTRAFGAVSTAYRDGVLSGTSVPAYRREQLGLAPAEFRELRGQLASFDIVAPRLAVLFETVARGLGDDLDPEHRTDEAGTAPLPDWVDRDRGLAPTLTTVDDPVGTFGRTIASIRDVHGLGETLPSIYRCLAQWPAYLEGAWPAVQDALSDLDTAVPFGEVATYVDELPYRPRIAPADLRAVGFPDGTIEELVGLFDAFNQGAGGTVLPAIVLHAATVDATGYRDPV